MHRPGSNPEDMAITDFLCDFCGRAWDGGFPMVEGHQGALICGRCLSVADAEVAPLQGDGECAHHCTMCLEERAQVGWASPLRDEAWACKRCINQAAVRLQRDEDWDWERPSRSG
jgi:hypothetical protein